jgi:hypothetical protein
MRIYNDPQETMSVEAEKAIASGLFPGAIIQDVYPGDSGFQRQSRTNIWLDDGETYTSPIDNSTTLVGEFVYKHNSLNGRMRHTHLTLK